MLHRYRFRQTPPWLSFYRYHVDRPSAWNASGTIVHRLPTGAQVMKCVPPEAIAPGMQTAADVVDRNGRLLLRAQQTISERHIRIFKMWGIATIAVTDDTEIEPSSVGETAADVADSITANEAAMAQLRTRFRHTDLSHPAVQALFEYLRQPGQFGPKPTSNAQ